LGEKPKKTIPELEEVLRLSARGVEKQITGIRKDGQLRGVGPQKGGHWEVIR